VLAEMKKNDIDKEIRMVVTYRSVSEDKFWRAFETGLSPHLTHVRSLISAVHACVHTLPQLSSGVCAAAPNCMIISIILI
jgi:hypothetical protein